MLLRRSTLLGILALGVLLTPLMVNAQQPVKLARIGFLGRASSQATEAFRQGLRDFGWVEGKNIIVEWRWMQDRPERVPELASELIRLSPDVILATASTQVEVLRQLTKTIPIVFAFHADPVGVGHVASLAHPGGNITGMSMLLTELCAKELSLLKEAVPRVQRIGVLWNPTTPSHGPALKAVEEAAGKLGVQLHKVEAKTVEEFDEVFSALSRERVGAVLVVASPLSFTHRARLADLALKHRLPTITAIKENAEAGSLMSYGPDQNDMLRRSAAYVDKILKGAKPADLPVEQATKFELVINRKAAKALGLTLPQSVLLRADRIIE